MSKADFFCPADGTCKDDIFVNGLRQIFSPEYIDSFISGRNMSSQLASTNTEYPIQIIAHSLGIVTIILIGLYLIWLLYSRLFKMSHTGQAVQDKETLMTIVRPTASFIAVFPTTYGFPIIVYLLSLVAMMSNGTTNWIMSKFSSSPVSMSNPFLFEKTQDTQDANGRYIYKTGSNIRSTGALRELNHLKEPAYIGYQHGLCLKHWSENNMQAFPYFPRSHAYGSVPSGKVTIQFLDISQRNFVEKVFDFAMTYNIVDITNGTTAERKDEMIASGSANPICGEFNVDFSTPAEVASQLKKSTSHTNQDLEAVQDEARAYRDSVAYRGSIVTNTRNVYQISAYLMGLDMAIGENPSNPHLKSTRNAVYKSFYTKTKQALFENSNVSVPQSIRNAQTSATNAEGLSQKVDNRTMSSLLNTHVKSVMDNMNSAPFMMGFADGSVNRAGASIAQSQPTQNSNNIDILFGLVDSSIEGKLDQAHYQILGNTSTSSQPNLSFYEQQLKTINERLKERVLAKGWLNAGNATSITKKLNEMLNSNLFSKTTSGKFYAMDMQTQYDDDHMAGINEHAESINLAISHLNTKVQQYPQSYVGTGVKMHAMMSNNGAGAQRSADVGAVENLISGEFIADIEKSILAPLMNTGGTGFTSNQQVFENLRQTGETALAVGFVLDSIHSGLKVGATATDGINIIGINLITQAISNAMKVALITVGGTLQELSDFLDNIHTFFSITMPMLPNIIMVLAGLGTYIQLVVTSIAVILYMILHAKPDTTFVGSNIQLYLLFLNVFLRMPLIYSAFLMTTVILGVIIPIAVQIWFNAKTDILSADAQAGFFTVLYALASVKKTWYVLAGLLTGITYVTASLIQEIPEMVASIMNTNVYPVVGALNTERFISGVAGGMSTQRQYKNKAISDIKDKNKADTKANQDGVDKQIRDKENSIKEKESQMRELQRGGSLGGGGISGGQAMKVKNLQAQIKKEKGELEGMKQNLANHSGFAGMIRSRKAFTGSTDYGTPKEALQSRIANARAKARMASKAPLRAASSLNKFLKR